MVIGVSESKTLENKRYQINIKSWKLSKNMINQIKKILPILAVAITLICHLFIEDSGQQKKTSQPYFTYFLITVLVIYAVLYIISFFNKKIDKKIIYKGGFYAGVIFFLNILNIITLKYAFLPKLFFPSLDRVLGTLVEDRIFLLECIVYSLKLLFKGFVCGGIVGFITGILLGFSKTAGYWLNPVTRILGPIPTTAWVPLALSTFPTSYSASVFLIAFAVWFPTALMTSSGIHNTSNAYFEVSRTLGASTLYQVFKVGIPNAMPNIFLGIFYGTCSSFITLMTAEMVGSSCGIGWYINWQKQMMVYPGVYAGLIIIAVICTTILTLLFKVRDRILVWQKGVIKW
ncbi:ABC transporter permease [Ruminiclostridium herbifermentans]|nr:ABC transporter permease subunit [Ruminiclostridium herbifermentans]